MSRRFVLRALAATLVAACSGEDPTGPPPTHAPLYYLKAPTNNGDGQVDTIGRTLPLPFRVLVERGDVPEQGATVKWEIAGDTLTGVPDYRVTSLTDTNGIATSPFRLTLGTVAGPYAVRASVPGVAVGSPLFILSDAPCGSALCFTAIALPEKPAFLRYVSGDGQIDTVGTTLDSDYVVQSTDSYGNAAPGAVVDWIVTSGGGTIAPAQSTTSGPNAYARARYTLGPVETVQRVIAKPRGLLDTGFVSFTVTGFTLLPVASVTLAPESATVNLSRTVQFSATLRDQNGAIVIWRHIAWTTGDPTIATVDTSGLARGVGAGTTIVIAESEGVSDTSFITVLPGPPPALFTAIVAGFEHSCGLRDDGTAYCWGDNSSGQLGNGTNTNRSTPVAVAGGHTFTSLVAGSQHTCGITASHEAFCWGRNDDGELGDGTTINRSTPVRVTGGFIFTSLGTGGYTTCGVTSLSDGYCWGWGDWGQLGSGFFLSASSPVPVRGGLHFASIGTGRGWHTCGITTTGAAYCWGHGTYGQVGNGSDADYSTPLAVLGGLSFTRISTGAFSTCALTTGGVVNCWGDNHWDELGDSSTTFERGVPGPVRRSADITAVTTGTGHGCQITSAGVASCWGLNGDGQIGDGSTTQRATPVAVAGGLVFTSVAGGGYHTCGLTGTGETYCWGANGSGQLGDGTTTSSSLPVRVVKGP
jgi:alpha-tubulin suppressor-like RCC1 family protein